MVFLLLKKFWDMPTYQLNINGKSYTAEAEANTPLLWVLRDTLGLTGTKYGCGIAQCGACTVHFNGNPVRSCSVVVSAATRAKITTIEGLSDNNTHPVQQAWLEEGVPQCGYCQSGQIMAAAALLKSNPNPDDTDIEAALQGHICRCGTYTRIQKAVKRAAAKMTKA
jgi:isoquinoline 1-oxidoreductase alpha subunit